MQAYEQKLRKIGTFTAGLSVLCCSHVRPKQDSRRHCIWVNSGVALLQFLLTFLFLLGWIWSITWGLAFLAVSKQFYSRGKDGDANRGKNQTDCYSGVLQVAPQHKSSPSPSSRAGSSNSINKVGSATGAHQHQHSHHHPQQHLHQHHHHHYNRHNDDERHSSNNSLNKQQHQPRTTKHNSSQPSQLSSHHHHHRHSPHHDHHSEQQHQQEGSRQPPRQHPHQHHYQQRRPHTPERIRLHQDDSDEVAVMPVELSPCDTTNFVFEREQRSNNLASGSRSVTNENADSAATTSTGKTDNNTLANVSDVAADIKTNNLSAVLPSITINQETSSSLTSVPVTTIPGTLNSSHDNTTMPIRRHLGDEMALQPIIALQQVNINGAGDRPSVGCAPISTQFQPSNEKIMRARTRHEKMLQRQMGDNDLSPFELTNQKLAAIIIHDLPVQAHPLRPIEQDQADSLPKY
ncbi:protein spec3-like isoform x1 [Plakobranchus ocellatus]|uniref:Protein spec3-like isoform x1 n=1 Tax=Plakobranchus ocellatus TaxID=259542 RepID=A0AAV4DNX3_9GAST|nr:protein spec3-like isoform x1 [Plakobranchus ocellatus]